MILAWVLTATLAHQEQLAAFFTVRVGVAAHPETIRRPYMRQNKALC